jgi:hypothetical protein
MGRRYSLDLRERVVRAVGRVAYRAIRPQPNLAWPSVRLSTGFAASARLAASNRTKSAAKAEEDCGAAPRLAAATVPEGRFHLARAGGGTPRAGPEGRLRHGVGVCSRREAQS